MKSVWFNKWDTGNISILQFIYIHYHIKKSIPSIFTYSNMCNFLNIQLIWSSEWEHSYRIKWLFPSLWSVSYINDSWHVFDNHQWPEINPCFPSTNSLTSLIHGTFLSYVEFYLQLYILLGHFKFRNIRSFS